MKSGILLIFWTFIYKVLAGTIQFPADHIVRHICKHSPVNTIVDDTVLDNNTPAIYDISGPNKDFFAVTNTTGIVLLAKELWRLNTTTSLPLNKEAVCSDGTTANIKVNVSLTPSRVTQVSCQKLIKLDVDEVRPVGEEVAPVECSMSALPTTSPTTSPMSLVDIQLTDTSGGNGTFKITPQHVIVIAKPLAFRNSIVDIYLANVTYTFQEKDTCIFTEKIVPLKIVVHMADCSTDWEYLRTRNVAFSFEPDHTIRGVSLKECQDNCSSSNVTSPASLRAALVTESVILRTGPCNSVTYSPVSKTCKLYNETEVTVPMQVQRKTGTLLFRKYCKQEVRAISSLRILKEKIIQISSLQVTEGINFLEKINAIIDEKTMLTPADWLVVLEIHSIIFINVSDDTSNRTQKVLDKFAKVNDIVFEKEIRAIHLSPNKLFIADILHIFDSFMNVLSSMLGDGLQYTLKAKSYSIATWHSHYQNSLSIVCGNSEITLPNVYIRDSNVANITAFVGTLHTGTNKTQELMLNLTRYYIGRELVSIIMEPNLHFDDPFQLDISTLGVRILSVSEMQFTSDLFLNGTHIQYTVSNIVQKRISQTFQLPEGQRVCAFFGHNESRSSSSCEQWATRGCWMDSYNSTHTRCLCTHLTSFTVLMKVGDFQIGAIHKASLGIITTVGCCISIASLTTTVATLVWFRLRSGRYVLLLHLSMVLLLAQVVFLAGIDAIKHKFVCRFVAVLLHYLYLSVFAMMLAEGLYLFHKLHKAFAGDHSCTMLIGLGWGAPLAIVAISLITDADGYGTDSHCWLSTSGAIWAFVGPALAIITINAGILIFTIWTFLSVTIVAKKTDFQKFRASVKATVVLLPLLGVSWLFGVIAVNNTTLIFQYLFAALNSLQGLFIFLFHVVLNEDVRKKCRGNRTGVMTNIAIVSSPLASEQKQNDQD